MRWPHCTFADLPLNIRATFLLAVIGFSVIRDAAAQEGVFRWRFVPMQGNVSLFQAASDATDAVGRASLSCEIGSGSVEVSITMRDDQRIRFGKLIERGAHGSVKLLGDESNRSVIDKLVNSDVSDWSYVFTVPNDGKWLDDFEKTGTLRLKVEDSIDDGVSLDAGLDAISAFRAKCRKPLAARPLPQSSNLPKPNPFPTPSPFPPARIGQ